MQQITPPTAEDLAQALRQAAASNSTITLIGNDSKRLMAGPRTKADVVIATSGLKRVLQYEPHDLTISVEAGMPFALLQELLARERQMIALDPPFWHSATVGGVIAANASGPMRRTFGTARDLVIGMRFATLEGKIVTAGGMVVKDVAGLDMGKLMIGSFGTLAAIVSINFRLHPLPEKTETFLYACADVDEALTKRDWILRSVLKPWAITLISPVAAMRTGFRGIILAIRAAGSCKVLARYAKDLEGANRLTGEEELNWWKQIRDFTPDFLRRNPGGVVLKVSTTLTGLHELLRLTSGASISHASSGVTDVYLSSWNGVAPLWRAASEKGWSMVVEFAPNEIRTEKQLWLVTSNEAAMSAFGIMKRVKAMFDPANFLNRLRLYGRI
jgi:glycolate oxidase FAD binding subunit